MQRPGPAGLLASGAVELELVNPSQEIAHIGRIAGHMILGPRIKGIGRPGAGRGQALILIYQGPPGVIVLIGLNLAGKYLPAPFIDQKAKGQEGNLVHGGLKQEGHVFFCARNRFK